MNRELQSNARETSLPERLLPLVFALEEGSTPEGVCVVLAKMFRVHSTELALLRREQSVLRFLYPQHLRNTGAIPISSASVAAHTALNKQAEIFNNFPTIKHASIFEIISPSDEDIGEQEVPLPIQKLMSVPIALHGDSSVLGVLQLSHKGEDPHSMPDFSVEDLHDLEAAGELIAMAPFLSVIGR
jgi:GAF domain-containing protein